MKTNRLLITLGLCLAVHANTTFACRYNVRDIGFIDLDKDSYVLYGYVTSDTLPNFERDFLETSRNAFEECNVRAEIVDPRKPSQHPAFELLQDHESTSSPTIVFVSPDGQSVPVTVSASGRSFPQALASALESAVDSPIRTEILDKICRSFGAILLIEGTDSEANEKARAAVQSSIERIGEQMKWMPKAIAHPPELIVMKPEAFSSEKILLWSLGLNSEPTAEPRAAVIYGKARWIGPMMEGEEIAEHNLAGIFSIIGADCECSFDISWTQGTRLPVRWDRPRHAELVKSLEFDPESPLIKMEASRILGRGFMAASVQTKTSEAAPKPKGRPVPKLSSIATGEAAETNTPPMRTPPGTLDETEAQPTFRTMWLVIGGLVVFIALAGVWIRSRADTEK